MKQFFFHTTILIALFCLCFKAGAQNQTVNNGGATSPVNFPGTGCIYNWVNDTPGIGLPASGTGNIASFTAVNTGSSPVRATITATPVAGDLVYVASQNENSVSVINTITGAVVTTIPVGQDPTFIAKNPGGTLLYVANNVSGTISVINTATNNVTATIPVGAPNNLTVSPDGSRLYVSIYGDNTVAVVNTTTNIVIANIPVGIGPSGIIVSPDGSSVYVANQKSDDVSVIKTSTNTVTTTIPVGSNPIELCISPDGSTLYVTNFFSNSVSVINTATNAVTATVNTGTNPDGISIGPGGKEIYVADYGAASVSVINAVTNTLTSAVTTGKNPLELAASPDGSMVYVTNQMSNSVSAISTLTNTVISTVAVASNPSGITLTGGTGCSGAPVTFTITVRPASAIPDTIKTGLATGTITACAGTASASPNIQQFTVSGSGLTGNITATAPDNFEVSLSATGGYGNSVTLTAAGDSVSSTIVYVRSAASAPAGIIAGNVVLTSPGATSQNVAVTGIINALPTVNTVSNQTLNNGAATTAVNFTGTSKTFMWTNDTPDIGLVASGTGNIPSFTAVNAGSSPITATVTVTPASLALAYIPNFGTDNVSVINTATGALITSVKVGHSPFGVSVSPDGSRVYISNSADSSVSVISTATNIVVATIRVGLQPNALCVSPDGSRVYVSNSRSNTVSVINAPTNAVTATILAGKTPFGLALSPDGSRLYVVNSGDNTVSVLNTANNAILSTIQAGSSPYGIAVSPDGNSIYVADENSNTLAVFNTATNVQLATIAIGTGPYAAALSPDGSLVYVSDLYSNAVSVISAVNYQVIANIHVGGGPDGISLSSNGGILYVANTSDNTVSVISTATNTVISNIPVGDTPVAFGNFIAGGTGCSGIPVTFTVTVNPGSFSPVILSANDSYSSLTTVYGTPSSSQSFNVAGTNLTAGISVTAPAGFEVSTDNINFSATVTVGGAGNIADVPVYIRLAATTPVGVYNEPVTLSSPGANNLVFEFPTSAVTPAPLTITADNKSKLYGQANPVLTVTYTGFVNHEGPAQLTANPVISTTAVTASPPGQYPVTVSGAMSTNYDFTYVNGVLQILADTSAVVVPNTFTPNSDGINDTWNIKNLNTYPNCTVSIYNRYGEKLYSSVGYGIAWDGTYRGARLPQGTYYYIINLQNGLKVLSGSVTIIR